MNRMRAFPGGDPPASGAVSAPADLVKLASALEHAAASESDSFDANAAASTAVELANHYAVIVEMDHESAEPLRTYTAGHDQLFLQIPQLEQDVADLEGLSRIGKLMLESSPKNDRGAE